MAAQAQGRGIGVNAEASCPLWSAQQHAWLTALGHTIYLQGSAAEPAEAPDTVEPVIAAPMPAPVKKPLPERVKAAPPSPRPAIPARRSVGSRLPDRLHFALIRASGCDPSAEGAAEIIAQWPASSQLHGNPAAKRALWPILRALRKAVQP